MRYSRLLVLFFLGIALLAASVAAAAPKVGTYTRLVTSTDLLKAGSLAPHGKWTLRIKTRGLSLDARGQGLVPERAVWGVSKVTISDTPGSSSIFCGAAVKGTYGWKRHGGKISFSLVKDACKDRVGVLRGVWAKSP
ncbi:MAG: hypothetical protein QOK34_55 [Gaiellaceae bacterium]|nr:hypothetical protein [Gaiellaceae bacterium]